MIPPMGKNGKFFYNQRNLGHTENNVNDRFYSNSILSQIADRLENTAHILRTFRSGQYQHPDLIDK